MFILNILLLVAIAALSAAHPHPHTGHTGECMEMRTSARSGRLHFETHPFKCMKDIKLPEEERLAKAYCRHKARFFMLSFFKGDKIDSLKNNDLEELNNRKEKYFASCMVDKLGLEAEDGSLDVDKIIQNTLKMESSDVSALMKMQTFVNTCVGNITGTNATEQFLALRNCIKQMVRNYCDLHQGLVKAYLQRGADESACAYISTAREDAIIEEMFNLCMSEMAVKSAEDSKKYPKLIRNNKAKFAQSMIESAICVAEKMSWYSEERGFDGALYREFVSNFTGRDKSPKILDAILTSMENCESEWQGDPFKQSDMWESCFAPKIVDICGFNNNVTKFFFPFINVDIQKAALEYIEDIKDSRESMEDFEAYDEGKDYDDKSYYDDRSYYIDDGTYEDGRTYEDDEGSEDSRFDEFNGDVDEYYRDVENVDDGLFNSTHKMTLNEPESDAVLVGSIDDDDDKDDKEGETRGTIDSSKDREDSTEDDAEEYMARMKKQENATDDEKTAGRSIDKAQTFSEGSKEENSTEKLEGESSEDPLSHSQESPETTVDVAEESSKKEVVVEDTTALFGKGIGGQVSP